VVQARKMMMMMMDYWIGLLSIHGCYFVYFNFILIYFYLLFYGILII